jgi:hypothetical protein
MRAAVVIFYWVCAVVLIAISVHAELHKDAKLNEENSHRGHRTH